MLVQNRAGEPITEERNGKKVVLFHDDDYREIGEGDIKMYERGSNRMMNPNAHSAGGVRCCRCRAW
jgi:hypothetical protein